MTHGLLRVAVVGMLLGVSAAAREKQGEADKLYEGASAQMRDSAWEAVAKAFDKLAESGGRRADAALYWHAYSLNKTARKSEALQALDRLSRQYPESRWMRDARALRLEIRQSRGETVSPEAQQDEELKLLALTGLMNAQPEKALPVLRKLFATGSPKVKERALFVLSQSTAPEAGELLAQVARDTSQPALQKKAIHFLGLCGDFESNARLLDRIYRESTSAGVKREVLHAYMIGRNSSRLIDLAKSESDPAMQAEAIRMLGMVPAEVTRGG